jgi:hypothetical protein
VERFHQALRRDFLDDAGPYVSLAAAQAALDDRVRGYNADRAHQSLDVVTPVTPADRFEAVPDDQRAVLPLWTPPALTPLQGNPNATDDSAGTLADAIEWLFSKLLGVAHDAHESCTAIQVSNREKTSGIVYSGLASEAVRLRLAVTIAIFNGEGQEAAMELRDELASTEGMPPPPRSTWLPRRLRPATSGRRSPGPGARSPPLDHLAPPARRLARRERPGHGFHRPGLLIRAAAISTAGGMATPGRRSLVMTANGRGTHSP